MLLNIVVNYPFAFLVASFGILLAVYYILMGLLRYHFDEDFDADLESKLKQWLGPCWWRENDQKLQEILKDYEISCGEIGRRDNIILVVGSILITSSFLIIGDAVTINGSAAGKSALASGLLALTSIGLYCIWLWGMHETASKLDNLTYRRIKAIEKAISSAHTPGYFGIHSYLVQKTHNQNDLWLRVRRVFWGLLLLLLSIFWLIFSIV